MRIDSSVQYISDEEMKSLLYFANIQKNDGRLFKTLSKTSKIEALSKIVNIFKNITVH